MTEKILFVVMPYRTTSDDCPKHRIQAYASMPYGVISLATYVKNHADCEVKIFDYNVNEDFDTVIKLFNPTIVALSIMFDMSHVYLDGVLSDVRKNNKTCRIVAGGMSASATYKDILSKYEDIQSVCYLEGEIPMAKFVSDPRVLGTCNAWITRNKLLNNFVPQKEIVKNLDDVINLDYSLIHPDDYAMVETFSPYAQDFKNKKQFNIMSSRGCCFSCYFCTHSNDPDKTVRFASVPEIIKHVKYLIDNYGMNVLTFRDDQILLNKERAKELFRQLAQFHLRIECPSGLTVAFIDDEIAGLMRDAGMDTAHLAIESGSPRILKIMRKPLKVEQIKPAVDILHKHGFFIICFIVNGTPDETDEDRALTTKIIKNAGFDWASIQDASPLIGTDLFKECVEKGYIPKNTTAHDIDMRKYMITTPSWTPRELEKKSYEMNLDVNFVNNRSMLNGDYKLALRLFTDILSRFPDHPFAYYYISKCAEKLYKSTCKNTDLYDWEEYFGRLIHDDME